MLKLEKHILVNIPSQTIFKPADATNLAKKLGVKVDWINKSSARLRRKRALQVSQTTSSFEKSIQKLKNRVNHLEIKRVELRLIYLLMG